MNRALKRSVRSAVRVAGFDLQRADPAGRRIDDHLRALLPRLGVDTVIDVGAHHGEFARRVRDSGFDGRIISIEPTTSAFERLRRAAAEDAHWEVHQLALGRESGERTIHIASNTQFSSFRSTLATTTETMPGAGVIGDETVAVVPLDAVFRTWIPNESSRVFLKIDTQGWDQEVIAGAERSLGSIVGIQTELSVRPIYEGMPHYLEALGALERLGFLPTGMFPIARDAQLRLIEFDCVVIRAGSLEAAAQT